MSITTPVRHGRVRATSSVTPALPVGVLVLLAGSLLALGLAPLAMPASYSWIEHGTSESAAQGIEGAWVARTGFILFGLAVLLLAQQRHRAWKPVGSVLHGAFAVSMFAVAAFSTKPWENGSAYVESEDLLHSVFATVMGFGFVAGVVAVMVARRLPNARAALPDIAAIIIASIIPLALSTSIWGLLQRTMFATAAAWYAREARSGS